MSYKIHSSGACGIVDPGSVESWICDLCQNEKTAEASLVSRPCFFFLFVFPPSRPQNPDCVLCARSKRDREKRAVHPTADSFLRVCKPTEGQGWVHLACAVFIPEVSFSDAKRLRMVEGISTIPTHRWSTVRGGCVLAQTTNTKMLDPAMHVMQPSRRRSRPMQRLLCRVSHLMRMVSRVQVWL